MITKLYLLQVRKGDAATANRNELKLFNIQESDEGLYECKAQLSGEEIGTVQSISLVVPKTSKYKFICKNRYSGTSLKDHLDIKTTSILRPLHLVPEISPLKIMLN